MVIETNCNQLFKVRETGDRDLAHLWYGIPVKRTRDGFAPKAKAREQLVSKAHTLRVVEG